MVVVVIEEDQDPEKGVKSVNVVVVNVRLLK